MMTISMPSRLGALDGLEGDGCRVLALLLRADDLGACPLRPGRELFDGGRPEGVRRSHDDGTTVAAQEACELADRGGLAHPVDTDDQYDRWPLAELEGGVEAHEAFFDALAQHPLQVGGIGRVVASDLGAQLGDDGVGEVRSEVGRDEGVLEVVPGVVVDGLLREHAAEGPGE